MRRIIVEGMDGSGKTTLINGLMERFHFLLAVVNVKGPDQDFDSWWPMQLNSSRGPYVHIHDRFFYSELVYGPVLRGYVKATEETVVAVQKRLRDEAMLIYCRPHYHRLGNNPQMEGVIERAEQLTAAYDHLMVHERNFYPAGRFQVYDWVDPKALPRIEAAVESYLERASDGALSTTPVTGSGGGSN